MGWCGSHKAYVINKTKEEYKSESDPHAPCQVAFACMSMSSHEMRESVMYCTYFELVGTEIINDKMKIIQQDLTR